MDNSLSIFIPFYNDAKTVEYMITNAYHFGKKLTNNLEIIAINDGSSDNTLIELERINCKYHDLKIVDHSKNSGYGGALISGINTTTKHWVFYTDGDAQYHLDDLSSLWDIRDGYDIINGYKLSRSDNYLRKLIGDLYARSIKKLFNSPILDVDCDYRLMRGDLLRSLHLKCTSGAITIEIIKKLELKKAKFIDVGVRHYKREYGQSTFFTIANILKTFNEEYKLLKELNNKINK